LDINREKRKISFNTFSIFSTALFWLWAVPLWVVLWFALGMFFSSGILCVLVTLRTVLDFFNSHKTFDD